MKNLKNQKGISLLALCLIIGIVIIFLIIFFGGNSDSDTSPSAIQKDSSSSVTKEDRSTYIAKCTSIDYTSLARNPNQYKGQNFVFTGEVIQVMEDNNELTLRVNITPEKYE